MKASLEHEATDVAFFRSTFPHLTAAPSKHYRSIAEQSAARGEPVPLCETAREIRARGYEVSQLIPDMAVLIEFSDRKRLSTVGVGRVTGYAWNCSERQRAEHINAHPEALRAGTAAELESESVCLFRLIRAEGARRRDDAGIVALKAVFGEALRRETVLSIAAGWFDSRNASEP